MTVQGYVRTRRIVASQQEPLQLSGVPVRCGAMMHRRRSSKVTRMVGHFRAGPAGLGFQAQHAMSAWGIPTQRTPDSRCGDRIGRRRLGHLGH
jgi:hypothetical protein